MGCVVAGGAAPFDKSNGGLYVPPASGAPEAGQPGSYAYMPGAYGQAQSGYQQVRCTPLSLNEPGATPFEL